VRKILKILLMILFLSLVVFAAIVDRLAIETVLGGLRPGPYLRLIGVLGMFVAVFLSWGYKRKIEASQKYVRAQEVLTQAGHQAEQARLEGERLEKRLMAEYEQKKTNLDEQLSQLKREHEERISALKEQNMALKESVGKLMKMVRKGKAS